MEQPPSPFKIPASPVTPLQQLSPDRINQQRIPASPSLPHSLSNVDVKLPRQPIDVQSKVAFLNSLNQAGSPSRQQGVSTHAALQRALLGREEAESALRTSTSQLAEAEVRQRKISERLESLMEELQTVKERQVHERQVFEKEVRKARKDAFRAGSALVKLQEDLKESRTEARNLKAEAQHERFEKEKSRQEAFERAYTLAGLLEETEAMREKMRAMEAAREAELLEQQSRQWQREDEDRLLEERRQQKDEEHATSPSEAHKMQEMHEAEEMSQPRQNRFERLLPGDCHSPEADMRWPASSRSNEQELLGREMQQDATLDMQEQLHVIDAELQWEKKLRIRAEEMVHFLQMECQFKICACRVAEKNGKEFVHDKEYRQSTPETTFEGVDQNAKAELDDIHPCASSIAPEEVLSEEVELEENQSCISSVAVEETLQPEEHMFNVSGHRHYEDWPTRKDDPRRSPPKVSIPLRYEDHSPSSTDLSPAQAPSNSSHVGLFSLSSTMNASSPAIFSAEDMTYQSPIRMLTRPKSACSISLRDAPTPPRGRSPSASPYPLTPGFKTPQRQGLRIVRAQTTTMMVPLRDNDDVFCPAPGTPGTPVSREAALAQIRARRDRARSVAMSGSKSAPGSARRGLVGGLRDISAPGRF